MGFRFKETVSEEKHRSLRKELMVWKRISDQQISDFEIMADRIEQIQKSHLIQAPLLVSYLTNISKINLVNIQGKLDVNRALRLIDS